MMAMTAAGFTVLVLVGMVVTAAALAVVVHIRESRQSAALIARLRSDRRPGGADTTA